MIPDDLEAVQWNSDIADSEGNQKIIRYVVSSLYLGLVISGFHCKKTGNRSRYVISYILFHASWRTTLRYFAIRPLSVCQSQIPRCEHEAPTK